MQFGSQLSLREQSEDDGLGEEGLQRSFPVDLAVEPDEDLAGLALLRLGHAGRQCAVVEEVA